MSTLDVVRGPAVVVDDKIKEPQGALKRILEQLEATGIPTIRMTAPPDADAIVHLKQFGLIVLDWELSYSDADDPDLPAGMTVPTGLAESTIQLVTGFVRSLLEQTALPIFIVSESDVDGIWDDLRAELHDIRPVVDERVNVYSKSDLEVDLIGTINDWIESRPALLALRSWSRAYVEAEIATFHHFMEADEDWVEAIHRAAVADSTPLATTLRELLSRNIISRIGPLRIELEPPTTGHLADATSLRSILHLGAVIPASALDPSEFGTGDLFVDHDAPEPYPRIRILITPECDLARGSRRRLTYLTAVHSPQTQKQSHNRVKAVNNPQPMHLQSCLLTPRGDEYDIALGNWESVWLAMPVDQSEDPSKRQHATTPWPGQRRIGRLLEPYISDIQQNFALATIRKGLPRIPDDFFNGS